MGDMPERAVVLAVDDDDDVRAVLEEVLRPEYDVVAVPSGAHALAVAGARRISAVVLDVLMPEMDGLTTLARLRELDPGLGVVMLTALDSARRMREAVQLGAVDYLAKPFTCDQLRQAVRIAVDRRQKHDPPPRGPILHVCRNLGARATLSVLLSQRDGVAVLSMSPDHLQGFPTPPRAILLETAPCEAPALLQTLAIRFSEVPIVVAATDPATVIASVVPSVHAVVSRTAGLTAVVRALTAVLATESRARVLVPVSTLLARAVHYVSAHYAEATVDGAAAALSTSTRNLARRFHQETGMTPREYVTRVRVEAAKSLLYETDLSQSAVAERVGVCDASHLSRLFRQYVGASPGECRSAR